MKKYVSFIFLFLNIFMYSQQPLNYPYIEKTTYKYYLNSDWESLIELGNKSLDKGIDFYYLQIRMGVAYFSKNNYRKSIKYLQKAYKTNPKDNFLLEYLYKAYLYSGRTEDARILAINFPKVLKNQLGIKEVTPIFSAVYFELKNNSWDNYKADNGDAILEQSVKIDDSYFSVNFENIINSKSKIFWGYALIKDENQVYKPDENNQQLSFIQDIKQNQFYFNYGIQFHNGNHFAIAINYIYYDFKDYERIRYGNGFNSSDYDFIRLQKGELAGNISFHKDYMFFKIGADAGMSSIGDSFQLQPAINLTFYPFGNTNLYLTGEFMQQYDFLTNTTRKDHLLKYGLGARIKTLYIEPYISQGKLSNFTRNNAFVVYNDNDYIQDEIGVKIYAYLFNNRLNLYAEYKAYERINIYQIDTVEKQVIYNNKSIIGGIKWNF